MRVRVHPLTAAFLTLLLLATAAPPSRSAGVAEKLVDVTNQAGVNAVPAQDPAKPAGTSPRSSIPANWSS